MNKKNNTKINFLPGKLFSTHLPGYDKMTEICKHNSNIPHYSSSITTSNQATSTSTYKQNASNLTYTTFNQNTYTKQTLNLQPISIFEFEESAATRLKRKQELKRQQAKEAQANTYLKKKEDNSQMKVSSARKTTIEVNQNFIPIAEFNKQSLEKLKLDSIDYIKSKVSDYQGIFHTFNQDYIPSNVNSLNPKKLIRDDTRNPERRFYSNIDSRDEINFQANEDYNIYCSDKVLAILLTMNLNSRAWHLKIKKINSRLFFDVEENCGLYYTPISESDTKADEEDTSSINYIDKLSVEASIINEYIKELIMDKEISGDVSSNFGDFPFRNVENYNILEKAFSKSTRKNDISLQCERSVYCYKEWNIDNIRLLVRCQIHFGEVITDEEDEKSIIKTNIYALNEYNVSY